MIRSSFAFAQMCNSVHIIEHELRLQVSLLIIDMLMHTYNLYIIMLKAQLYRHKQPSINFFKLRILLSSMTVFVINKEQNIIHSDYGYGHKEMARKQYMQKVERKEEERKKR